MAKYTTRTDKGTKRNARPTGGPGAKRTHGSGNTKRTHGSKSTKRR